MKLKKIASLMLAGVMAVSMLTACGEGKNETKPEGEGNGEGTTASGYSAMLGEKAADVLKKNDLDKVFTFVDNEDDQDALAKLTVSISDSKLKDWITQNYVGTLHTKYYGTFQKDADLDRDSLVMTNKFITVEDALTKKVGEVWVANDAVSMDYVMDKIYESCKEAFKNADKDGEVNKFAVNYNYTVSVSVVNKALESYNDYSGSVNFIAVTVTRTSEFV